METQVNDLNFNGENIFAGIDTRKKNWKVALNPCMSQRYFELIKRMDSNKTIVRIAKKFVARIIFISTKEEAYKVIK